MEVGVYRLSFLFVVSSASVSPAIKKPRQYGETKACEVIAAWNHLNRSCLTCNGVVLVPAFRGPNNREYVSYSYVPTRFNVSKDSNCLFGALRKTWY
ncbi:unnamed protein product [Schistosoma spindalis]|nr:unnamed protein product [Schistosoma spindale]